MKKLNQKGFSHHLLIFALLALVVGAAGFAGWRIYKNKSFDAQAADYNYSDLTLKATAASGERSSIAVFVCKIETKTGFGTFDKLVFKFYSGSGLQANFSINTSLAGSNTGSFSIFVDGALKAYSIRTVYAWKHPDSIFTVYGKTSVINSTTPLRTYTGSMSVKTSTINYCY